MSGKEQIKTVLKKYFDTRDYIDVLLDYINSELKNYDDFVAKHKEYGVYNKLEKFREKLKIILKMLLASRYKMGLVGTHSPCVVSRTTRTRKIKK